LDLPADTNVNPSGGPLAANPVMATGLIRIVEVAQRIIAGEANRGLAHATGGQGLQHNPLCVMGGEGSAVAGRFAVGGVRQTHHKKRRDEVSIPGLVREAALRALDDAEMTFADVDALVIGKAPDAFEGIVQPELFLADALGAAGKPMLRVHTAGSVGGSTFIV